MQTLQDDPMERKGRWLQRREVDLTIWRTRRHKSSPPIVLTVQCTYLQIGSSRSSGGFRKLPSFTAEDVDPRGDLGPPSGSPISTSVRPFWKGLLERRSPILPLCTGCCRANGRKFMSLWIDTRNIRTIYHIFYLETLRSVSGFHPKLARTFS